MHFKKIILSGLIICNLFNFTSCNTSDALDNKEISEVLGEWELYRDESLESIIDQWMGTEWTFKDQWFANNRDDSRIILMFNEDGTFEDRYADVVTANGVWVKMEEGRYSFDYIQEGNNLNEALTQRRFINIYCENTFSVVYEGNERRIDFYRKINTTECSELIVYNGTD